MVALTVPRLVAAAISGALAMALFESRKLTDLGLHWNRSGGRNLLRRHRRRHRGRGAAHLSAGRSWGSRTSRERPMPNIAGVTLRAALFTVALLFCGAAGEEIAFRGFPLQMLMRGYGSWASIVGMGALFGRDASSQPRRHRAQHRQHGRFRHPFRRRAAALARPVAAHRNPFRLERHTALPRRAPQRIYNQSYGVPTGMESRSSLERRPYGPEASLLASFVLLVLAGGGMENAGPQGLGVASGFRAGFGRADSPERCSSAFLSCSVLAGRSASPRRQAHGR